MSRWWLARLALIAVGLLPVGVLAYEREEVDGKPGVYLFWQNRSISYAVNLRGSGDLSAAESSGAIKRAVYSWSSPSCTDIAFGFSGYDAAERTNIVRGEKELPDRKNLIVWHEDRWPPAGVTDPSITDQIPAVTTLVFDAATGAILDGDIDVNGVHFVWSTSDDPPEGSIDLESVMAHEVGHLLGLNHSSEPEASMSGTLLRRELKKRSLERDDIAGVCFVYPFQKATPAGPGEGTLRNEAAGGCQLGGRAAGSPLLVLLVPIGWLLAGRLRYSSRS